MSNIIEKYLDTAVIMMIILTALAGVAVVVAIIGLAPSICASKWQPRETKFVPFVGCLVRIDGNFVPDNAVRILDK